MSQDLAPAPNCPFYARHIALIPLWVVSPPEQKLLLIDSGGNQCGLRIGRYSPCELVLEGKPVEWRACPVMAGLTVLFDKAT